MKDQGAANGYSIQEYSDPRSGHQIRFEPPDLVLSHPSGDMEAEDTRNAWEFISNACANTELIYWIANISNLGRYAREAQQTTPKDVTMKLAAFAVVGGSFQQRTIISILMRAARTLGMSRKNTRLEFFPDEAAARVWIEQIRKERAGK